MLLGEFCTSVNLTGFHVFALMHVFTELHSIFLKFLLVVCRFTIIAQLIFKTCFGAGLCIRAGEVHRLLCQFSLATFIASRVKVCRGDVHQV